jgi:hypothetical protein
LTVKVSLSATGAIGRCSRTLPPQTTATLRGWLEAGTIDVVLVHDGGVEALAFEAEAQRAGLGLDHELAVVPLEAHGVVGVAEAGAPCRAG